MNKFTNSNTWLEALNIYLFDLLIKRKLDANSFVIEDYSNFHLTDTLINEFNNWVDENGNNRNNILEHFISSNKEVVNSFESQFGVAFKPKVVLWSDREKTSYFNEKLQIAFDFEQYIYKLFSDKGLDLGEYTTPAGQYNGENELGVEIKNDTLIKKTGNIYIEYMEKLKASNSVFVNSGILKEDNTKYILIGDYDGFWIFRKDKLIEIYNEEVSLKQKNKVSPRKIRFVQIATSKGYLFPLNEAIKETISIDTVIAGLNNK